MRDWLTGRKGAVIIMSSAVVLAVGVGWGIDTAFSSSTGKAGQATPLIGSTPSASPVADSSPAAAAQAVGAGSCTIGESGHYVQVTLTDASACAGFGQTLAQDVGGFWQAETLDTTLTLVCVMNLPTRSTATVLDSGGEIIGRELCQDLQAAGDTENTAAEAAIVGAQQSASAAAAQEAASASAAAAASASQSAADSNMESTASGDLYTLANDVQTFPDYTQTIGQAVSQAASDLKQEKADAAGSDGCVSVANSVYNDAVSALYNDQQSALYNGVNGVAQAIGATRKDVGVVQQDQKNLAANGLPGTSGASARVQSAETQISSAISTANQGIDSVAANVSVGYQLADTVLSGSCSGAGVSAPGSAPTPPAHLS